MIPKKAKDLRKDFIKDNNYDENLVNDLLDFYWKEVRKTISTLTHHTIRLDNIGSFKIKHWKLDETVTTFETILKNMEGKFSKYAVIEDLTKQIENINKVKQLIEKDTLKLTLKKEKRKHDESIKNSLEQQTPDLARDQEQDI